MVLEFLHGVRGEFPDDVSGAAVGFIFTGHESELKNFYVLTHDFRRMYGVYTYALFWSYVCKEKFFYLYLQLLIFPLLVCGMA